MVQKLSEPLEEQVRQYLVDNIRPSEIEGYDPTQTDSTASDFLPVTNDWSDFGDYYPIIVVQETDGPVIPNSGNTNVNGIQGDGSGSNQFTVFNVTISCQTTQGNDYLNGVAFDNLVQSLYAECHDILDDVDAIGEAMYTGRLSPPTQTRSEEETSSGSTETWIQRQGTIPIGVMFEP